MSQTEWRMEDAKIWKGALASLMSMCFREGIMHSDRGWLEANKSQNITYRKNTDELSTWKGFLKDMEENAAMGNPKVFERAFEAAILYAKQRIEEQTAFHAREDKPMEEKDI